MQRLPIALLIAVVAVVGCGSDTTSKGPVSCADNPTECVCKADSDCSGATPRCDPKTSSCVKCLPAGDNCPAGQHCVSAGGSYTCVPQATCTADIDCPKSGDLPGICCSGTCADPQSDANHCGSCGNVCGAVPNGTGGCINGSCGVVGCNPGFGDCDKKGGNGCEADLNSSLQSCGACGNACKPPPNTKTTCEAGQCVSACNADFADCDGNPSNGCETSTTTNPNNCGACGKICPKLANTTNVACVNSTCVVGACSPGYFDCNKMGADGCESDIQNDPNNCSGCGKKCPAVMNGAAGCTAGNCGVGKCNPGFDDCDRNVLNGCEQDLLSDPKNCGACGVACNIANGAAVCQAGKCVLQACNNGFADCDLNVANGCETNLLSDLKNCGACANACPAPKNATASCSQGVCGIGSCMYGFADCNKNLGDGCETNILQVNNCGACGAMCSPPANATNNCNAGTCAITACNAGFADCDMKYFNGCEINLTSDAKNCAMCGNVCSFKNGNASCVKNACVLASCQQGWGDCNNNPNDGCETDLNSDAKNCTACGMACPNNNPYCNKGVCGQTPPYPAACSGDTDPNTKSYYTICAMDVTGAWIASDRNNPNAPAPGQCTYAALAICQKYNFTKVTRWGGTCGIVCGYCDASTCKSPSGQFALGAAYTKFDSGGGNPQGGGNLSCTVQWECSP